MIYSEYNFVQSVKFRQEVHFLNIWLSNCSNKLIEKANIYQLNCLKKAFTIFSKNPMGHLCVYVSGFSICFY